MPSDKPTPTLSARQVEAFWAFVREADDSACWPWLGVVDSHGYGSFRWSTKPTRRTMAHRIAFILERGEVPAGLELDHLCRNPRCCNPAHLEPVTHAENIRRRDDANPRTHCRNGHEFTPANTRTRRGKRECRTCIIELLKAQWKRGTRQRGANG